MARKRAHGEAGELTPAPTEATPAPPYSRASDDDEFEFMAYGLRYIPLNVYVYIGSTGRGGQRGCEHFNLASGARRVVMAFAQTWWQPNSNFFSFDPLWRGTCTPRELKAIEQYLMDKHGTRVHPRPTNGVVKDTDLLVRGPAPRQLNVNRACADEALVAWAARHVANSTALVALTPAEALEVNYAMDTVRLVVSEAADATAQATILRIHGKYTRRGPLDAVPVHEVHADLNAVFGAASEEDGAALRECLLSKLAWYNSDKRGADHVVLASVVAAEFAVLAAALGVAQEHGNERATIAALKRENETLHQMVVTLERDPTKNDSARGIPARPVFDVDLKKAPGYFRAKAPLYIVTSGLDDYVKATVCTHGVSVPPEPKYAVWLVHADTCKPLGETRGVLSCLSLTSYSEHHHKVEGTLKELTTSLKCTRVPRTGLVVRVALGCSTGYENLVETLYAYP